MKHVAMEIQEILDEECYNRDLNAFERDVYIKLNYDIIKKVVEKRYVSAARKT